MKTEEMGNYEVTWFKDGSVQIDSLWDTDFVSLDFYELERIYQEAIKESDREGGD